VGRQDEPSPHNSGTFVAGTVIGAYRVIDVIGTGGMGTVYLAEHMRLGRLAALKVLKGEHAGRPGAVSKFFAEARATNQIRHENIVEVTDFIEDPDRGVYSLVMELLTGETLRTRIGENGALPLSQALAIASQVASALAAAHDVGIIHHDLKPENIFVSERAGRRNFVKILDFGVARLTEAGPAAPGDWPADATATSVGYGAPAYMSPEQGSGKPVDHRTDIYSFGVILYEMVTGEPPFRGGSADAFLRQHLTAPPPRPSAAVRPPRTVPAALDRLVLQCLAKDPDERPLDMVEVKEELQAIVDGLQHHGGVVAPRRRSHRWTWFAVAAFVTVVAGAGVGVRILAPGAVPGLHLAGARPAPAEAPLQPASVTPAKSPVQRATVTLSFQSVPEGAEVWQEGRGDRLGVTPFTESFELGSAPVAFELRKAGFETVRREVVLERDAQIAVDLVAVATPVADAGRVEATGVSPDASPGSRRSTLKRTKRPRSAAAGDAAPAAMTPSPPRDVNALIDSYGD
jgi:serine/threonine-protein kinase